jgi:hypothetical protein
VTRSCTRTRPGTVRGEDANASTRVTGKPGKGRKVDINPDATGLRAALQGQGWRAERHHYQDLALQTQEMPEVPQQAGGEGQEVTSLLWLLLLPYAYAGGFVAAFFHHREVFPERCNDQNPPWCFFAGLFWPLVAAVGLVVGCAYAGWQTSSLTPARRRKRRDAMRGADLRAVEGRMIVKL